MMNAHAVTRLVVVVACMLCAGCPSEKSEKAEPASIDETEAQSIEKADEEKKGAPKAGEAGGSAEPDGKATEPGVNLEKVE